MNKAACLLPTRKAEITHRNHALGLLNLRTLSTTSTERQRTHTPARQQRTHTIAGDMGSATIVVARATDSATYVGRASWPRQIKRSCRGGRVKGRGPPRRSLTLARAIVETQSISMMTCMRDPIECVMHGWPFDS